MKSICIKCNIPTNHSVVGEKEINYKEDETGWWEDYKYQIIQCQGCDSVSFRILTNDAQQQQLFDHEELGEVWSSELFPKRTAHTLPIKQLANTPQNIKGIYRETIDAINNGSNILCSGGIRAIIEEICNDKGIDRGEIIKDDGTKRTSKNLDGKIEGLASNGFLTNDNAEILHDLRFLGNEALHASSAPSQEELKLAINIIEHTLDNIYELHFKAKRLKAEKTKRTK